jgi:hypothetical protein
MTKLHTNIARLQVEMPYMVEAMLINLDTLEKEFRQDNLDLDNYKMAVSVALDIFAEKYQRMCTLIRSDI